MKKNILSLILLIITESSFSQSSKNKFICVVPITASFPGGNDSLKKFIAKHFNPPDSLPNAVFTLKGRIQFSIQRNGIPAKFEIIEKAGYYCDEEIIRILQLTKWQPASDRGKFIEDRRSLPYSIIIDPWDDE